MVQVAPGVGPIAVCGGAFVVGRGQGDPLRLLEVPLRAAQIQRDRITVEDGRQDPGLAGQPPPASPSPSLPLGRYAGCYANAYYGDACVELGAGGAALDLVLGPAQVRRRLRHQDGDLFAFDLAGENAPPGSVSAVQFSLDGLGRMQIEYYAEDLAHGLFERVADGR